MVKSYRKFEKNQLSQNLSSTDFDCKCNRKECDTTFISDTLINGLQTLWKISGPFQINSGFRCIAHNAEIGGAPASQHTLGKAADCQSSKITGHELAYDALSVSAFELGGIGTASKWCHLDVRGFKKRWVYPIKL